ncbi:hypothetical protein APY04_1418 [Hyphomicrobium sulfonivorans]|uniref:Uncharacterized protein n=1 Tax=Hyphomicrobium sulfonivorans TaxID=121290 RepID=A0A109BIX1_HYPSL|nr:hypothetical protein APY04_1418 [Hyphomicrobium sulfonivorans]
MVDEAAQNLAAARRQIKSTRQQSNPKLRLGLCAITAQLSLHSMTARRWCHGAEPADTSSRHDFLFLWQQVKRPNAHGEATQN